MARTYQNYRNYKEITATEKFTAKVNEICERMDQEDVHGVYFVVPSVDGRGLGKIVMRHRFRDTAFNGIRLHYGAITDARVDLFGELIGFAEEEIEGIGIPDLDTFHILPWESRYAQVFCFFYNEETGELLDHDSRGNLLRLEEKLAKETDDLQMLVGIEPEMMWLRQNEDGSVEHFTNAKSFYEMTNFHEFQDILAELYEFGSQMGISILGGDSEDSSQIEMNQDPNTPLKYADAFLTYRQLCNIVAKRHGLIATFMPKPFMACSGNGHHHHVSLVDASGENVIAGDRKGECRLSEIGVHFLGGLMEHADGITLVGAPTVNSYKRYWDIGYWAPFHKSYSYNNRTTLIRVPAVGRFEVRHFDSSCNPYHSIGALLVSGLDGMKKQLDPGEPNPANAAADLRVPRSERIPITMNEAIEAFEADDLMKELFLPGLYHAFLELRKDDWTRYWAHVSDWEREFYLDRWP